MSLTHNNNKLIIKLLLFFFQEIEKKIQINEKKGRKVKRIFENNRSDGRHISLCRFT
jgi:hypothetical protein